MDTTRTRPEPRWKRLRLPASEVCMFLRVDDRIMVGHLVNNGRMVQLYDDGLPYSFPITRGEAGWDNAGQQRHRPTPMWIVTTGQPAKYIENAAEVRVDMLNVPEWGDDNVIASGGRFGLSPDAGIRKARMFTASFPEADGIAVWQTGIGDFAVRAFAWRTTSPIG